MSSRRIVRTKARLILAFFFATTVIGAEDVSTKRHDSTRPSAVLKSYGRFATNIVGHTPEGSIFTDVDRIAGARLIEQTNQVPCVIG